MPARDDVFMTASQTGLLYPHLGASIPSEGGRYVINANPDRPPSLSDALSTELALKDKEDDHL
jgi:hypothetical protein